MDLRYWLFRNRGCLRAILVVLVLLALGAFILWRWYRKDVPLRYPDYSLDIDVSGKGRFRAGAAKIPITPEIDPDGEEVWLAGYLPSRTADGVHDDLWARAIVIEAGDMRVAICALDLVGLFHDDVIAIRGMLDPVLSIDYTVIVSTHTHSGPDTMGLWGKLPRTGVRPEYNRRVQTAAAEAITHAATTLVPVRVRAATRTLSPEGILADSRKPEVMDPELAVLELRRWDDRAAVATIVNWSCHPEVLDPENRKVTSDFPHYLREGVEGGLADPPLEGRGGICLFVPGSVGGLQTPLLVDVVGPDGELRPEATFEKAQALGERLAAETLTLLGSIQEEDRIQGTLGARARTVHVPLQNSFFHFATKMGAIRRGMAEGRQIRTEVGLLEVAGFPFLLVPGEIYPEIVVGGIESPEGADFDLEPQEVPPLKEAMAESLGATVRFVVGLANDEIGYLIPKSEWDEEEPFLYGAERSPYGEIVSPGPDAAGVIHRESLRLIREAGEAARSR